MEKVTRVVIAFAAVVAMLPPFIGSAPAAAATGLGSSCTRSCGNVSIPYPFGVEPGCYHDVAGFNLTCNHSYHPPMLFLGDDLQVLEISIPTATVRISVSMRLTNYSDNRSANKTWGIALPQRGPYPYFLSSSYDYNMIPSFGCSYDPYNNESIASCTALSPTNNEGLVVEYTFYKIDIGYSFYNIQIHRLTAQIEDDASVYVSSRDYYNYTDNHTGTPDEPMGVTLSWMIANSSCPTNVSAPECHSTHSSCLEYSWVALMDTGSGHSCNCSDGYQGNPYVADGCQDIDECSSSESYSCYGDCKNTPGSFICLCPAGYKGNAFVPNGCQGIAM
nr:unnamed protein product [Digitaria exilis]